MWEFFFSQEQQRLAVGQGIGSYKSALIMVPCRPQKDKSSSHVTLERRENDYHSDLLRGNAMHCNLRGSNTPHL